MKTHISPAIIMRVKDVGESDLLVTFFTPQRGRLKGVAKGARKSRKRFVNALDLFSLVTMDIQSWTAGEPGVSSLCQARGCLPRIEDRFSFSVQSELHD
jgi:DNA repair protein RecO